VWRSIIIFVLAYVAIATGRLHKAIAAVLGGCLLIALKGVSQEAAYGEIDLNVIFLLLGMMILAEALAQTGLFQWVAITVAKRAGGNPITVLICLVCATAALSAFLDNVTIILVMAPVAILIADQLEVEPSLFLILEAIASNIGGTATLVGDPPNLLIGSRVGLSFNKFIWNLTPVVLICMGALVAGVWLLFRRRLHVPEDIRARVRDADPSGAITDRRQAVRVGAVMGLVVLGFFLHDVLGIQPSVIALAGAMLVLIITKRNVGEAFAAVEWSTLMFFVGLFILVAGLDQSGVLSSLAGLIVGATGHHLLATALLVMWGSAVASALVDNIPFVAAMIPVIGGMVAQMGLSHAEARPLWWALALGACLGGNATLVGASANVVMAGIAEKHGHHIGFGRFTLYGVPTVVVSLSICSAYLWLRYFAF